uniref:Uncharacterized protein n=1 Tax=Arundo donax TaxID=35708 RepID=A0A0A9EL03_ARUDO
MPSRVSTATGMHERKSPLATTRCASSRISRVGAARAQRRRGRRLQLGLLQGLPVLVPHCYLADQHPAPDPRPRLPSRASATGAAPCRPAQSGRGGTRRKEATTRSMSRLM